MSTSLAPETDSRQGLNAARSGPLSAFWHLPSVTVARFTLRSYLLSGWLWGELVFVLAFFPVFWTYPGTEEYFFSTGGVGLGLLALVGTAIMVHRAMSARVYLPLARLPSRAAYARGLALAAGVLRVPWYVLLLGLALAFQRIIAPRAADIVIGSLGAVANCLVVSTLVVALSPPIATRLKRIAFLAWLVIALAPVPSAAGACLAGPRHSRSRWSLARPRRGLAGWRRSFRWRACRCCRWPPISCWRAAI